MVHCGRIAQKEWEKTGLRERIHHILKIEISGQNADMLSETISRDNGKTRIEALATEILPAAMAALIIVKTQKIFKG